MKVMLMKQLEDELTLNVYEIFRSLQGEGSRTGLVTVFIRLAGCDLRCSWCDTLEAATESSGRTMTISEIALEVEPLGASHICVTGGEPLLQKNTPALCLYFSAAGYDVIVETNGTKDISLLPEPIVRIMDVKCPSSNMSRYMNWYNLQNLRKADEVKFVIADRNDYEYAREIIEKHGLGDKTGVLLSPLVGPGSDISAATLAEWMLYDDLPVRFQLQLHKIIWPTGEPK